MRTHEGPFVLGLDGGTEGLRVGLLDRSGNAVAFVRESYPTRFDRPGWAEQDPGDWWTAAVRAVRRLLVETRVSPSAVRGLALACTSYTLVSSDENGVPLRPAVLWMDVRSRAESKAVAASGQECLRYSGFAASAEWMPAKAKWLRSNDTETWERTRWISDYVEWMGFRLTGEKVASKNSVAIRCYYDRLLGGWPRELWAHLGLDDLEEKLSTRIEDMGGPVGTLSSAAAAELGLEPGTPIAQGGADAFVGMVGLGVVEPGPVALITGSSHLALVQTAQPEYSDGLFGAYTDAVVPGSFTVEGGQASTGSAVNWFRRTTAPDVPLEVLSAEAAQIAPGAEGVMAMDHFQGNRTPYVDPDSRGMFWGISLNHRRGHLFRALLESVCFGTENILRGIRAQGHDVREMVVCGGAVNSREWLQIHADVSGMSLRTTEVPEAVTLGAGVLAAVGAGWYPSVVDAARAMVRTASVVHPDPDRHEEYRPYLDLYLDTYQAMRPLMARSAELVQHASGRG